jgi:FixJ family two-component response regulator
VRSFGYRAQTFGSGEEFLASNAAPETACVLLDVRMPGTDGLEVQRPLAERGERLPIVFLTAQASDDEERRARSAGAAEFLRKPVGQARLRRVLENVLPPRSGTRGDRDGE